MKANPTWQNNDTTLDEVYSSNLQMYVYWHECILTIYSHTQGLLYGIDEGTQSIHYPGVYLWSRDV